MVRKLPIVKIGRTEYFIDERLNELRNIKNPFDVEKMEASAEFYIKTWKKPRKRRKKRKKKRR